MTQARFDDLRPQRRRCFRLQGPVAELSAHTPSEVPGVLARAEAEVAAGRWVAGWVSYEAAPAFDDSFTVREVAGTPFEDLPLAFFAVFERRERAEPPSGDVVPGRWRPTIDAARHARDVADIRERIARGETYQVNHTFRMAADFDADPADLYGRIAHAQRGGFGAFIDTGRWAVVSASPELFLDWSGDRLECRPMKGTARRGVDAAADEVARAGLLASAKDRAENLMIVDMVRNDLARVAVPGTVGVHDLFAAERYDTVWQLTSGVGARTRPGTSLVDVFTALFPCASITGAPRSSTMAVISEQETTPRGVYCGAIGFGGLVEGSPRWVFNVGIRTVLVDRATATAWYGTGGGITHDSTAAGEFAEAVLKAEVLSRAPARFSLLETMTWAPDEGVRRWSRHRDRARAGAAYFDIDWDQDRVEGALAAAVAGRQRPARLRLLVDQQGVPSVEVADLPEAGPGPVLAVVDTEVTPSSDPFVRHKTTQRARHEAARARHPGADDVVLVNERGEVSETTIANLAARIGGRWLTPPLDSGCLPGTTRAELVSSGVLVEAVLLPADLVGAEGLARFNAVRGWEELVIDPPLD